LLSNSPVLFSWENANTSSDASAIAGLNLGTQVAAGSWLNDIAINPTNGNEIVLVYSNYNITGLFHSLDGGTTLTAIEGNLSLNDDQGASGFTGPSMRAAEIVVDWQGKEKYYVATSIGLYYTETLAGDNTEWTLETSLLNNVVIEDLDSRPSDNTIVAGTHGRGIFIGQKFNLAPVAEAQVLSIDENTSNNTEVGVLEFAEPEGDAVTITIVDGNTDNAFSIDNSGSIKVNDSNILNFEATSEFQLTISINDGELTTNTIVNITINNINESPLILAQSFSLDENSGDNTSVGTVTATDQDGDELTFSIIAGNINDVFSINPTNGELSVNSSGELDFESTETFTLTIKAEDTELNAEATITVNINDVNEGPVIENQTFDIDENSDNASFIGTILATDPENDELTFSITDGNTNDIFEINTTTGEITVKTQEFLNFEWTANYLLTVVATDGEFSQSVTITIDVNDINEIPEIENQEFSIEENSANDTNIGSVISSDPDGDELSYSIKSGNSGDAFKIDPGSGELSVNDIAALDFEINESIAIVVQVTDAALTNEANVSITITDVNETPLIVDQTFETDEGLDNGLTIASVVASDPENDNITFSLKSGNTDDAFSINATTGVITINDMTALEFDANPIFSLVIEISDGELTAEATITIGLIEVILSIEDEFKNSIKVYPNPVRNILNVDLSLIRQENLTIELTNMLGQQQHLLFEGLHTGEFQRNFDLSNFSKGYYILNFKYSDKQISKKLIIR
jgi:hypothetical protein